MKSKIVGSIFAHASGDYLGMPVEFASTPAQVQDFFGSEGIRPIDTNSRGTKPAGYYTDDTAMMLCLAQSLIDKGFDTLDQFQKYKKWAFEGYMSADGKTSFGIGQNTLRKLMWQKPEEIPTAIHSNDKEGGNGALMRCLPIGLIYHNNTDDVVDKSIKSALVTHNNTIAVWTTVVFNTLITYCLHNIEKEGFVSKLATEPYYKNIPAEIKKVLDRLGNLKTEELKTSGYSLNTLEVALHSFFSSDSLEAAIKASIGFGGDTDTQGAVTGGLAGAYYGYEAIPKEWTAHLLNKELMQEISDKIASISLSTPNT